MHARLVILSIWCWIAQPSVLLAASAAVLRDGSSVVLATDDGDLYLWKAHFATPQWSVKIHGLAMGTQSRIAALRTLPDNTIAAVGRHGDILLVSSEGKILKQVSIFYGYVALSVDLADASPDWLNQIKLLSSTSAAYFSLDAKYIYLASDEWSSVSRIALSNVWAIQNDTIRFSDDIVMQFKDRNFTIGRYGLASKLPGMSLVKPEGHWVTKEHAKPTALASCADVLLVGNAEGYVEFVPEGKDKDRDRRIRRLADPTASTRDVLDAGCVSENMAFTVSVDTGNGQIQLWDLQNKLLLSQVGLGSGGHPGMALVGAASNSGRQILSLGDGDVRLWDIINKKILLKTKYWPKHSAEAKQSFAAVALDTDDFVFGDGQRLWRVPSSGGPLTLYAGQP